MALASLSFRLPWTGDFGLTAPSSVCRFSLGAHRLLQATVVLPTVEHFPDPYHRSEVALQRMFHRAATQMQVNPADVDVTLFASGDDLKGMPS